VEVFKRSGHSSRTIPSFASRPDACEELPGRKGAADDQAGGNQKSGYLPRQRPGEDYKQQHQGNDAEGEGPLGSDGDVIDIDDRDGAGCSLTLASR
jgi:hypothetical protein